VKNKYKHDTNNSGWNIALEVRKKRFVVIIVAFFYFYYLFFFFYGGEFSNSVPSVSSRIF